MKINIFGLEGYLRPSWAMWRHLGGDLGDILGYVGVSWGALGPSWGHLGPSWRPSCGILGGLGWGKSGKNLGKTHIFTFEGYLRPSWPMWRHLGGHLAGIWGILGYLGPSWGHLGGHLGLSWGYLGPAWEHVWGEGWLKKW